jgi:hypothetical protein
MEQFRTRIREAFRDQLEKTPFPSRLTSQILTSARTARRAGNLGWLTGTAAVVVVAAIVALVSFAVRAQHQPAASIIPTPSIVPSASVTPMLTQCLPTNVQGCLSVTPTAGPVGTVVVLEGTGCNYPGRSADLVFVGKGFATVGFIPVDNNGHFRTEYKIPDNLTPGRGESGGPVRPGPHGFRSAPPMCSVPFLVTPAGSQTPSPSP